jgi:hypothetical protein
MLRNVRRAPEIIAKSRDFQAEYEGSISFTRSIIFPAWKSAGVTLSGIEAAHRAIRPWLTSTFDELIVYC